MAKKIGMIVEHQRFESTQPDYSTRGTILFRNHMHILKLFLRTASTGAEVESPVVLASRAVAVEYAASGRRGLQEEEES